PGVLLHREVPHVPGVPTVSRQYDLLFASWMNTITGHTNIITITRCWRCPPRPTRTRPPTARSALRRSPLGRPPVRLSRCRGLDRSRVPWSHDGNSLDTQRSEKWAWWTIS